VKKQQLRVEFEIKMTYDPFKPNVDTIINEINVLILNKDIILPSNISSLLDQEYGFKQKGKLF